MHRGYLGYSRPGPTLSPRGFVFPDRLNTLDRRPGLKSPRSASLRSRFPMRPSLMLQEERPLDSRVSRLILTLSSLGFVFPDRLDTLDRRSGPKSLRRAGLTGQFESGTPLLLEGCIDFCGYLVSTSPLRAWFRVYV